MIGHDWSNYTVMQIALFVYILREAIDLLVYQYIRRMCVHSILDGIYTYFLTFYSFQQAKGTQHAYTHF